MLEQREDGLYAEIKHYDRNYFGQFAPAKEDGKKIRVWVGLCLTDIMITCLYD